jgi:lactate racemase-like protein
MADPVKELTSAEWRIPTATSACFSTRRANRPPPRLAELSEGRFQHQSVQVRLNRPVVEHDVTLVVGPVFPHEVVRFSSSNKYFFPGIASLELINVSRLGRGAGTYHEITGEERGRVTVTLAAGIPEERVRAVNHPGAERKRGTSSRRAQRHMCRRGWVVLPSPRARTFEKITSQAG